MAEHLQKYLDYIRNTKRVPLKTEWFDEDWDPVGPMVRSQLVEAGLITVESDGIRIVEKSSG